MTKPIFKDPQGRWLVRSLFKDYSPEEGLYWLDDIHQAFLDLRDPTGIKLANKYFGGVQHLAQMLKGPFKDEYELWIKELHMIFKAEALDRIMEIMRDAPDAQALSAAKYVAELDKLDEPKRGRPSKEELSGALKQEVKRFSQTESDAQRIGLKLVVSK